MTTDPENPLLLDVLTGSSNSYTANPDEPSLTEVTSMIFITERWKFHQFFFSIQQLLANAQF